MHSEPAKYVQASLWCNWYQHIAYGGAVPKVLYPNCCGSCRRLGSLQSCVALWKPFFVHDNKPHRRNGIWLIEFDDTFRLIGSTWADIHWCKLPTGSYREKKKQVWRMQAPAANVKWSLIFKFMTWMALYEKLVSFPDTQCVCCTKGLGMRPMNTTILTLQERMYLDMRPGWW